jgi:dTDP-glucose 4,6-dehydratase/UDP-glucuronate decarboxylase
MKNIFKKFIYTEIDEIYTPGKYYFLKNKNILITGATGLLGQYFIAFFLKATTNKYKPKNITLLYKNKIPNYLFFLKKNKIFKFIKIDLVKDKLNIKNKFDYILHLATYGQPKKFSKLPLETFFLNTLLLKNLTRYLKNKGIFLFISTSEVYFGLNKKPKENEIGKINPNMYRAPYIFSKLSGETFMNILKNEYNLNTKSVRLCLSFGPGNRKNDNRAIYEIIKKGLINKKINLQDNGLDKRSYIYNSDALKMIINILFFGKKNIYNVGGEKLITIKKLAKEISNILEVPFDIPIKKKRNLSAPKLSAVNIDSYNDEFGKVTYKNFKEALIKTINWQKLLYKNL